MPRKAQAAKRAFSGALMRAARETKGLTRRDLSIIVGVTESTLRNYEAGAFTPDVNLAQRIAFALGVKLDALFS